jgi:hypothetical protein
MHIHTAGRHQRTVGDDLATATARPAAHLGDAAAIDRHVARETRRAAAVDHGAAAYDQVMHGGCLRLDSRCPEPDAMPGAAP